MNRILIVEDNLEVQQVLKGCLNSFDLMFCLDIQSAQHDIKSKVFDLILLDIGLPDGDGMRFFMQLKNRENPINVPVIFLTARNQARAKITDRSNSALTAKLRTNVADLFADSVQVMRRLREMLNQPKAA